MGRLLFFERKLIGIAETVVNGLIEPDHHIEGQNVLYIRISHKLRDIRKFADSYIHFYCQTNDNIYERSHEMNEASCKDEEHRVLRNNEADGILQSYEKGGTSQAIK